MIRIRKHRSLYLPAVSLYRDDLDCLIEIITSSCKSVEISDDDFNYETLDEMRNKTGANPRNIQISGHQPYVTVAVRRLGLISVHVFGGSEPEAEPLFLRVSDLLQKRERILSRIFDWRIWTVALIAYLVFSAAASSGGKVTVSIMPFSALVSANIVALVMRTGSLSRVSLTLRHETDTFWHRNGEKVVLGVALTILGVILKSVWDWLVARF